MINFRAMAVFILTWTAAVPAFADPSCLPFAEVERLAKQIQNHTARLLTPLGNQGTGVFVQSPAGTQFVTAHHVVVVDESTADPATSCEPDNPPKDPQNLESAKAFFGLGKKRQTRLFSFNAQPHNFSFENDLVKIFMPVNVGTKGLEVESSERTPFAGEPIIIAGYPASRGLRFSMHRCVFNGFGESIYNEKTPAYRLDCPDINYDIAGMSGGIAISACTGKVIGTVSAQNFDARCSEKGDPKQVYIAPYSQNRAGQILLGLQQPVFDTNCHYEFPAGSGKVVAKKCDVGPGHFPVLDPAITDLSPVEVESALSTH